MKGEIFNRTVVIADATVAASTTGFDGILYILAATGGSLQECDEVGGTYTAVDASHYISNADGTKIAYIGYKKFVKVTGATGVGIKFNPVHQG